MASTSVERRSTFVSSETVSALVGKCFVSRARSKSCNATCSSRSGVWAAGSVGYRFRGTLGARAARYIRGFCPMYLRNCREK